MNIEYFRHFVEIVNEGTILKASKKIICLSAIFNK